MRTTTKYLSSATLVILGTLATASAAGAQSMENVSNLALENLDHLTIEEEKEEKKEKDDDGIESWVAQTSSQDDDDNGWYVSLSPSLVFGYPVDIESDGPVAVTTAPIFPGGPAIVANIPLNVALDTDTGFGVNGAAGYRFDDARVELEVAYTRNNVDGVTVNNLAEVPLDGEIDSFQFMVNGFYDIPTQSRFSPYVGGGVGIATLSASDVEANIPGVGDLALDDTGVSFVFQVKAGVAYEISDQASAFLGYRLHGIPGQSFEAFGADLDADTLLVHSLQLGARYEF